MSGVENKIPETSTWGRNFSLNTCNIYDVIFYEYFVATSFRNWITTDVVCPIPAVVHADASLNI